MTNAAELTYELATWREIYQQTVLKSGGQKALAKASAVIAEIQRELDALAAIQAHPQA